MASVTGHVMATAMKDEGAIGALHRFMSISDNIVEYTKSPKETYCSIGLGNREIERAQALVNIGAKTIVVDVASGANIEVVNCVKELRYLFRKNINIIVGNFATKKSIEDFKFHLGDYSVDAWKLGIGSGSSCVTRVVTGCGLPTLASVIDCSSLPEPIIADGGIRNSGDFAKCLAAGATMVMVGGLIAGTDESASTLHVNQFYGEPTHVLKDGLYLSMKADQDGTYCRVTKTYSGSASAESYEAQGKTSAWRTPEGETFSVPYTGPLKDVLQQLDAGLRSSMGLVGAKDLIEFKEMAELVQITSAGERESRAHGKT